MWDGFDRPRTLSLRNKLQPYVEADLVVNDLHSSSSPSRNFYV